MFSVTYCDSLCLSHRWRGGPLLSVQPWRECRNSLQPWSRRGGEPGECLEVQPELTYVIRDLVEGVGAGGGTGCRVAAGVARVPDVGGVGGDGRATGGAVEHTADSKPSSTVAITTSSLRSAL